MNTQTMEEDGYSMTPPVSPILQPGFFDDDQVLDHSVLQDPTESSVLLLCCQGAPVSCSNTNSNSLLHQGVIQRLQKYDINCTEVNSGLLNLFGYQFDFETAVLQQRDLLFMLARSAFCQLENANDNAGFMHVGDSSEYMAVRQDIRSFFDYILLWLKCHRDKTDLSKCLHGIFEDTMMMSVFVGRLHQLPPSLISCSASKQGNKCTSVKYHYFHLCLEVHWALIEVAYILNLLFPESSLSQISLCEYSTHCEGVHTDGTTQLIELFLWDLISLAMNIYNKISDCDYHRMMPFSCSCVQELTITLIQIMMMRQESESKQSFWVSLTSIIKHLTESSECQQDEKIEIDSCMSILPLNLTVKNPVGFGWWYLLHVTPLYCFDSLGKFSQTQLPVPSNYYLLQHLVSKSLIMNEAQLRVHLRCCLTIMSYWEINVNIVTQLWENFYKKLNETFKIQTTDIMGHAYIKKSAVSLYESCQQMAESYTQWLESDSSFQLFLRILAQCLCTSKQQYQIWRQIKGRFYSKFHVHRVEELTDVGLQNMSSLFVVLGFVADTTDVSAKLCDLLTSSTLLLTATRQAAVWRALFCLVHLHQYKDLTASYITEKLASMFDAVVREFSECSDQSKACSLWSLISLYLDSTTDLIENNKMLAHQEYILLSPGIQLLLNKTDANELKVVLTFIEVLLNKIRMTHTTSQSSGVQELANRMWNYTYAFVKQHATTQTPPGILADVAACFCMLLLEIPQAAHLSVKEDFSKCFFYFSVGSLVNPLVSCHFLSNLLPEDSVQDKLMKNPDDSEVSLIHAWFRCHWYLLNDSETLQNLTRLMIQRPLLAAILNEAKGVQTKELPVVCQFLAGLGSLYNSTQDLKSKMECRDRAEKYFGDAGRHISTVLRTCGSSSLSKQVYNMAGYMVKYCSTLIYSNMKPNCLLPVLLDKLILPRSLVVQGKELPPSVATALRTHLHLYLSGFISLDFHSDPYLQRKLKEIFRFYFPKFLVNSTVTMSGVHVHPFVAALTDDQTSFRQYILQMVVTDQLNSKSGLLHSLQYLLELFHKSKLVCIARDTTTLLVPLLTLLVENTQQKQLLTELVSTLLEANRKQPQIMAREQLRNLVAQVIQQQLPVHQSRVFKGLESVIHSDVQLFVELIPAMTGAVKHSELKRGLGKDKQLRLAYCGLLQYLGSAGCTEKSKLLTCD